MYKIYVQERKNCMDFVSLGLIIIPFALFFGFIEFCDKVIEDQGSGK
jgi:hypothetical protein